MLSSQFTLIDDIGDSDGGTYIQQPRKTEFSYNNYDGRFRNNYYSPSYEMTYPGFLERQPIPTLEIKKPTYSSNFANPSYQQNPYRGYNPNDNNCVTIHEHFANCKVCSKIQNLSSKVYITVIIALLILIIILLLRKK